MDFTLEVRDAKRRGHHFPLTATDLHERLILTEFYSPFIELDILAHSAKMLLDRHTE